ncbi:MAG TPA: hypothetical protein VMY37_09460 [Thermoguttaceae bacterium]|nr:hypothetical protein [Thermoguttaceae bacterium]
MTIIEVGAAGLGWFVDPTPSEDEGFVPTGDRLSAIDRLPASDQVDRSTAIAHDLGDVVGPGNLDADGADLTSETLRPARAQVADVGAVVLARRRAVARAAEE